jgi:segregation and condensation protein A
MNLGQETQVAEGAGPAVATGVVQGRRPADLPDDRLPAISPRFLPPESPDPEIREMLFRVDLDIFRGPLDLLLYLVRKHELDIGGIPIARITDQFLAHLEVLEQLDVNVVGDFLEMAGILIEIKSKMLLPDSGEQDAVAEDPRQDLVRQLLEYKRYKDAASILDERHRAWQQCYLRVANDLESREPCEAARPIHEVELWDLVSAFGRIMAAHEATARPCNIVYDETPIHVYMRQIHERLQDEGQIAFSDMFYPGMHKSSMIGIFLAVLELIRNYRVQVEQHDLCGEIFLLGGEGFQDDFDASLMDGGEDSVVPACTKTDPASNPVPANPR